MATAARRRAPHATPTPAPPPPSPPPGLESLAGLPTQAERVACYCAYITAFQVAAQGLDFLVTRTILAPATAEVAAQVAVLQHVLDVYRGRYPDILDAASELPFLSGYLAAVDADPRLSFAAYAAEFFGDAIVGPPPGPEPESVPESTPPPPPPPPPSRAAARAAAVPTPLPGQLTLPLGPAEPVELVPVPAPAADPDPDAAERAAAAAAARAVGQLYVAAGRPGRSTRPWPPGVRVKFKSGRRYVVGALVHDLGDGTIEFLPDGKTTAWTVDKAKCARLKDAAAADPDPAAAATAPESDAVPRYTLTVPTEDAAVAAAYLARPVVAGAPPGCTLLEFSTEADGFLVAATVCNGTPGQSGPYVAILAAATDDDGLPAYEHPPQAALVGQFRIRLGNRPAILEIVAG